MPILKTPAALLVGALALTACDDPPIRPTTTSSDAASVDAKGKSKVTEPAAKTPKKGATTPVGLASTTLPGGDATTVPVTTAPAAGGSAPPPPDAAAEPIVYPSFEIVGQGPSTCDDRQFSATQKVKTSLTAEMLTLDKYYSYVDTNDYHQDKANDRTKEGLGPIVYSRPARPAIDALKAAGFNYAPFAIFATGVQRPNQSKSYAFSQPVPVYPFPAALARYRTLASAPGKTMTWTTQVSGEATFALTVTMTLGAVNGTSYGVTVKNDYQDPDHKIASDFPLPATATYMIDGAAEYVVQTTSQAFFYNKDCADHGDTLNITFTACSKTSGAEVKTFNCPQVVELPAGRGLEGDD